MDRRKGKDVLLKAIIAVIFIVGVGFLVYPFVSDIQNRILNYNMQQGYNNKVENNSDKRNKEIWSKAKEYNREHLHNTIVDAFKKGNREADTENHRYKDVLSIDETGMMGYIEIPKVEIRLSIFHGVSEKVLENGVGHLAGTSFPVGGKGSHCVLAAHRGLPAAKLFTDLDQLQRGDVFFINVLDKKLGYKIDSIKSIKPEELVSHLGIIPNRDIITLLTCTPYGVNTHRLLVRGHRIPIKEYNEVNPFKKYIIYGTIILGTILTLVIFYVRRKNKKKTHKNS